MLKTTKKLAVRTNVTNSEFVVCISVHLPPQSTLTNVSVDQLDICSLYISGATHVLYNDNSIGLLT